MTGIERWRDRPPELISSRGNEGVEEGGGGEEGSEQ